MGESACKCSESGLDCARAPRNAQADEPRRSAGKTDEIEVDTDGILQSLIVVDIDGFEVLPEGDADPSSETEGHWHVYVNNRYKAAVSDGLTFELSDAGHAPGDQISITVALAHDNHDEISDADGRIDNTIELVAVGVGELSE